MICHPKEGVLRSFIARKNPSPRLGLSCLVLNEINGEYSGSHLLQRTPSAET
jgi:hypothetical protein